mmetsp:Transcript_53918/g.127610  ORF Transcript_53918/g.127610 Transcript_53918/m.127610 type:complete len:254 (+) Transcript_53918:143-904(+)
MTRASWTLWHPTGGRSKRRLAVRGVPNTPPHLRLRTHPVPPPPDRTPTPPRQPPPRAQTTAQAPRTSPPTQALPRAAGGKRNGKRTRSRRRCCVGRTASSRSGCATARMSLSAYATWCPTSSRARRSRRWKIHQKKRQRSRASATGRTMSMSASSKPSTDTDPRQSRPSRTMLKRAHLSRCAHTLRSTTNVSRASPRAGTETSAPRRRRTIGGVSTRTRLRRRRTRSRQPRPRSRVRRSREDALTPHALEMKR